MILKLTILLVFTKIILVNSRKIVEPVENSNKNEYMSYGWQVIFPKYDNSPINHCHGTFISPRVFISDAWCMLRYTLGHDYKTVIIGKSFHNYFSNRHVLSVNVTNIYFHEDLTNFYDIEKRQVAVLITNEPVNSEIDRNGYINLNSNFDDINTTSCFIPSYDSWNITYTSCEVMYFENDNPNYVICLNRDISKSSGSSFICHLKTQPDVKVLVGILSEISDITRNCGNSEFKLSTIENVSGLGGRIAEKIKELL